MVAFAEVYVDESGTHQSSDMIVVAGYVFRRVNARRFQTEWSRVLRRYGLPYFHMTDCATGNGFFKDWKVERRLEVEKKLIALVKRETAFGFAMGMKPSVFRRVLPGPVTPYTFLLNHSLLACQQWALRAQFKSSFAYFFEAGHESRGQAHDVMTAVTNFPPAREASQYHAHSFIPKQHAAALQAADLLAWLSRNALEKREAGNPPRKDFTALLRENDLLQYFDETSLRGKRGNDPASKAVADGWVHTWTASGWREHLPPELRTWPRRAPKGSA